MIRKDDIMNIDIVEWIGFGASFMVLISLIMSSIIKLRWINLIGSLVFSIYGLLINSYPVTIMNLGIVFINIYYLFKIYSNKRESDYFKILEIAYKDNYFDYFTDYYASSIKDFQDSDIKLENKDLSFFILRNLVPAGLFLAREYDTSTLLIDLDFVIPEYRDFKVAEFLYSLKKDFFIDKGYTRLMTYSNSLDHTKYLLKMGFSETIIDGNTIYTKIL